MAARTNLYIGTDQGLLICRRGGETWHVLRHTLESRPVIQIVPGIDSPAHLTALVARDGVFYSVDGGQEWTLTLPAVATCLIRDPQLAFRLYVGLAARNVQEGTAQLGDIMVSEDGGQAWRALAGLPGLPLDTTVLGLAVTQISPDPPVLWAGLSNGGVAASYDQAAGWQWRRVGLDLTARITHLVLLPGRRPGLFAAGGTGIYYLELKRAPEGPLGATVVWRHVYQSQPEPPEQPEQPQPAEAAGPQTPLRCLVLGKAIGASMLFAADAQGRLWSSSDQAVTWAPGSTGLTGLPAHESVTALLVNPAQPDSVFLGTAGGQVYESSDRGEHWVPLGLRAGGTVRTLALAPFAGG
jgi:photosystem II stability/assembly factor-like uncharacterized protein